MNLLNYFKRKRILSPKFLRNHSLDKDEYVDLSNQTIDCSKLAYKFIKCNFTKSEFAHSNSIYWIENKVFVDCIFNETIFRAVADHGNKFQNCTFESINFKNAIMGYDSSCYTNCTFKNVRFGSFIKPQFKDCHFIKCNFYGVDCLASSFEHCTFVGKLDNVWFRGGFPTESMIKEFGYAKENKMLDVSFEKATLHDITFSDNCNLSTVLLPKQGTYLFFDNWNEQLNTIMREGTLSPSAITNEDIASFVEIYKVHSLCQKYYILNVADLLKEYSVPAVEIIKNNATLKR